MFFIINSNFNQSFAENSVRIPWKVSQPQVKYYFLHSLQSHCYDNYMRSFLHTICFATLGPNKCPNTGSLI